MVCNLSTSLTIFFTCVAICQSLNPRHLRASKRKILQEPPKVLTDSGDIQSWGKARAASKFLYILNGYPKKHRLLKHQAEALLSQGANITTDSLLLTSHEEVLLSANPLLKTSKISPLKFCSPPSCNNVEGDDKFLGAVLLANATRHGFQWLVLGDDDTTFYALNMEKALQSYDPSQPHFFAMQVDEKLGGSKNILFRYKDALARCPALGDQSELRFSAYDLSADATESRGDCNFRSFRDNSWFRWGYGGKGLVLSAGLLDQIPISTWQKCIDRITSFGGDVRVSMCLALLGHKVKLLQGDANKTLSKHKLTEGELASQSGSNA